MNFSIPTNICKMVFAAIFGIFGIMHFMGGEAMAGMVPIPGGVIWVYLTGLAMIAYAIATIMNHKLAKMAGYLLALFVVLCTVLCHMPMISDPASGQIHMLMSMKNIAMAAAAIIIANQSNNAA